MRQTFTCDLEDPIRLDRYLLGKLPNLSRAELKNRLVRSSVNGRQTKLSHRLKIDDSVVVEIKEPENPGLLPEDLDVEIIYEDSEILVINKKAGLTVHPSHGHSQGTLVNFLRSRIQSDFIHSKPQKGGEHPQGVIKDPVSNPNHFERAGVVHRLDKDTSGVMLLAKNIDAETNLKMQFKNRSVNKTYLAIVQGVIFQVEGRIEKPIGRHPIYRKKRAVILEGKPSVTVYTVLERFKKYTMVKLKPLTGRTHQIRVHMASEGHPILGDRLYNRDGRESFLHLISYKIEFNHPATFKRIEYEARPPEGFKQTLERLRSG